MGNVPLNFLFRKGYEPSIQKIGNTAFMNGHTYLKLYLSCMFVFYMKHVGSGNQH